MTAYGQCTKCVPGRYCDRCRDRAREQGRRRRERLRARAGVEPRYFECYRCLGKHASGEKHCPLAAEYEPPGERESDTGWVWP